MTIVHENLVIITSSYHYFFYAKSYQLTELSA